MAACALGALMHHPVAAQPGCPDPGAAGCPKPLPVVWDVIRNTSNGGAIKVLGNSFVWLGDETEKTFAARVQRLNERGAVVAQHIFMVDGCIDGGRTLRIVNEGSGEMSGPLDWGLVGNTTRDGVAQVVCHQAMAAKIANHWAQVRPAP